MAPLKKTKKKLALQEIDEEAPGKKRKKKALVAMDLYALPQEPVELECPLCHHEGPTSVSRSCGDRGKVVLFWIVVAVFVCLFFVFILAFIVLQQIVCKKGKGCGDCCTCRGLCARFTRFQPKVGVAHYCTNCKKQIGMAK